ncbi:MAG: GNAT family N-acetyltransferase [Candidatus Cloacimonetes bacterium]|nr:GNAT family N-acetyltransferase [Candidatus Cloacimonadota bacterium]
MKYFRKLSGERCYLSPISLEDVERYTEWINDPEIAPFLSLYSQVVGVEEEREMLKQLISKDVVFSIVEKDTNKVIGNCGLHNLNSIHRTASFGIFIGEKTFWTQGIGLEATQLTLDFGFNILNLNSIELNTMEYNKRGIRCFEKAGFKLVGSRRQAFFHAGKYHDILFYDILASEYESIFVDKSFNYSISDEAGRSKITIV